MTASQIIGARYLQPLRLARAQNGAGAEGALASDLAAYNRWIAEYGSGDHQQSQQPCSPPTPIYGYSLPGHDHSGGVMGKPQKHTVWLATFGYLSSSYADFENAPQVQVTSGTPAMATLADCEPRGVWIPGGRVYENLDFVVRLNCATTVSDYAVTFRGANGQTYETTGTLSLGANDITIADVGMRPGRLQNFYFSIRITYGAGTSTVHLIHAALHQSSDTP